MKYYLFFNIMKIHPDFFNDFIEIVKQDIIKSIEFPDVLFNKY